MNCSLINTKYNNNYNIGLDILDRNKNNIFEYNE